MGRPSRFTSFVEATQSGRVFETAWGSIPVIRNPRQYHHITRPPPRKTVGFWLPEQLADFLRAERRVFEKLFGLRCIRQSNCLCARRSLGEEETDVLSAERRSV